MPWPGGCQKRPKKETYNSNILIYNDFLFGRFRPLRANMSLTGCQFTKKRTAGDAQQGGGLGAIPVCLVKGL